MTQRVVLMSGGMDSLISYQLFTHQQSYVPVFLSGLSSYWKSDIESAHKAVERGGKSIPLRVIKAPEGLEEWENGVVPHRNILLLAFVANVMRAKEIMVSSPKGELIEDQQPRYYRRAQRLLHGVTISNPLRRYTKAGAVAAFLRARPQGWTATQWEQYLLSASRSCYSATTSGHCGECAACLKRYIALSLNGLEEQYENGGTPRDIVKTLKGEFTVKKLLRYGLGPSYETWRALRS